MELRNDLNGARMETERPVGGSSKNPNKGCLIGPMAVNEMVRRAIFTRPNVGLEEKIKNKTRVFGVRPETDRSAMY